MKQNSLWISYQQCWYGWAGFDLYDNALLTPSHFALFRYYTINIWMSFQISRTDFIHWSLVPLLSAVELSTGSGCNAFVLGTPSLLYRMGRKKYVWRFSISLVPSGNLYGFIEKSTLHCKHSRYWNETHTIVFTMPYTGNRTASILYSSVTDKISLFVHVIYSPAVHMVSSVDKLRNGWHSQTGWFQ